MLLDKPSYELSSKQKKIKLRKKNWKKVLRQKQNM